MKIAFLINPISGGGIGARVYRQLPEIMASFGFAPGDWTAELTEAGRIEEQTDRLLASCRRLIAVGGDGTVGFVLYRLTHFGEGGPEIGLIPLGTGNDLGRALGVYRIYTERGLLACVKRILLAQSTLFDLWRVGEGHTLASYISCGMDAAILHDFDTARKHGLIRKGALYNKIFYLRASLAHAGFRIRDPLGLRLLTPEGECRVDLQGRKCCLIANIDSYAAGSRPFPGSRFDDGLLEVLIFDSPLSFIGVTGLSRLHPRFSTLFRRPGSYFQAREIDLLFPAGARETPFQLDGEDLAGLWEKEERVLIRHALKVRLLDLRRGIFSLF